MNNTLIAYYSFSGTTRKMAKAIAAATGGDILELIPEKPYDFSYNTASKEARNEIARGYCPKLLAGNTSIHEYDIIFVGSPNWFKSIVPPVLTFLHSHDFTDKTIVPFCTHGGGGFGEIETRVAEECNPAKTLSGLAVSGDFAPEEIVDWLKEIKLL